MAKKVHIGDALPNGAIVLKKYEDDDEPNYVLLLCLWIRAGSAEFVTWKYDECYISCNSGHYFSDIDSSLEDFHARRKDM